MLPNFEKFRLNFIKYKRKTLHILIIIGINITSCIANQNNDHNKNNLNQ